MTKAKLKIILEFGSIDNKAMTCSVICKDQTITVDNSQKISMATLDIDLPNQVLLIFSGKDMNNDTVLDEHGNIVKDLFVKVQKISIDDFVVDSSFIHRHIVLETSDRRSLVTNYIGFNGTVKLDFNQPSVFKQIMAYKF